MSDDTEEARRAERWEQQLPGVPLVIVESPYRALVGPFAYLDVLDQRGRRTRSAITFVVIPEYVARHWWERILYNQTAEPPAEALLGRPNTVVANVPYRREDEEAARARPEDEPTAVPRRRGLGHREPV